jgi:ATP-dependent Lon protease
MEIIDLSGYIVEEKIEIARKHLVSRQLAAHGVKSGQLRFTKKVLERIIQDYTRESGVRNLEKMIAKVIRSRARAVVGEETYDTSLSIDEMVRILGPSVYNREQALIKDLAGVMTGLAWTQTGGEVLYVEVSISKGKGLLSLTGNLGDVMKESATLAYEYLKSHASLLDIHPDVFPKYNVHLHVPEGATPKDGPSAGITMFAAMASAFTQRKVKPGVAMTGEITLRGKVLPVGGIKEKILAAKRNGLTAIVLSEENRKDVDQINKLYLQGLEFQYIDYMIEVVDKAMLHEKLEHPLIFEV